MREFYKLKRKIGVCIVFIIVLCPFVLAACGTNSSVTGETSQPSPTPSPTPTSTSVRGYGSAEGCPSDVVVSTAPAPANVTVRPGQGHTTFAAHKGDVVEVEMPFGVTWKNPTTSGEALQMQAPSGYVWKSDNSCIWRFVARNTGTVKLSFFGTPLCKNTKLCPPGKEITTFTIEIT